MLRLQYSVHAKLLQSCPTLWEPMACSPPGSSVHGNSPGKNTGVGSHFLLQGIFPTQVSYISCIGRQILYQYSVNIAFICTGKKKKKKKKCDLLYCSTHFITMACNPIHNIPDVCLYTAVVLMGNKCCFSERGQRKQFCKGGHVLTSERCLLNGVFYGTTGGWVLKPEQTNSIGEAERKPAWPEQMRETGTNWSLQGLQPHRSWGKAWVLV